MPPLRISMWPERLIDFPEIRLNLTDRTKLWRVADVLLNPLEWRLRKRRTNIIDEQLVDAAFQRRRRNPHTKRAAHRRAKPMHPLPADSIHHGACMFRINVETIVCVRVVAPLRPAAPNRVRTNDMKPVGKFSRNPIEITTCPRQPMPHHQRLVPGRAPLHVVHLTSHHCDVLRLRLSSRHAYLFLGPLRAVSQFNYRKSTQTPANNIPTSPRSHL